MKTMFVFMGIQREMDDDVVDGDDDGGDDDDDNLKQMFPVSIYTTN